ncbi:hypothetical protein AB4251_09785 [Vibrio lentus]|uniref:Uncharacterized protein n=1 Tax=Vibrio lentus TaxID=136468 RepID=A0AB36XK62_9VIBR|nr:hypothetical protein [Vibrio lentus]MCC4836908.1 hypothetical protein [Vibrio lentus]PMI14273.1 hypothetical protein BCU51_09250 [Vibrio lentus]PMK29831.1 hypothetical protein BCU02_05730 [Vibrio lentus]PMK45913.1 hypothetical protein BCT99_22595 [Vibrio lentus]PML29229.1 hypothetical protein BCT79_05175 [Vibrio lentus]
MARKTTLLTEHGCTLVQVEELDANRTVLSTAYEMIDVDWNIKTYSSKIATKAVYVNRGCDAGQLLGFQAHQAWGSDLQCKTQPFKNLYLTHY